MHASRFGLIPNSLVCPTSLKDYKCHDQYCTMYNTCHSFVSIGIVFCIALSHSDFLVFFFVELATIVGPSVAAIAVLIIILIIIIVIIKRKTLKLPTDLQGESLFHSRRFSTASQLSDISLNNHQMRSVP